MASVKQKNVWDDKLRYELKKSVIDTLDPGVKDIVIFLNHNGYKTLISHQGEDGKTLPFVKLRIMQSENSDNFRM